MNLIFEQCIRHGNPLPSFEGTDAHQVAVAIHGVVRDPRFLAFLEQVGQERLALFNTEHFLVVDLVHREQPVPENLQAALRDLLEQGTVERPKRGRLILSRRFHAFLGRRGTYTRRVGLDRDTNKMLLLKHIKDGGVEGSRMDELMQVLPQLSRHQVAALLRSLRSEGQVECRGRTRSAKWFPTAPAHAGGRQAQSGSNMRNAK
jgi:ATP-dependent DNA helicase RecG